MSQLLRVLKSSWRGLQLWASCNLVAPALESLCPLLVIATNCTWVCIYTFTDRHVYRQIKISLENDLNLGRMEKDYTTELEDLRQKNPKFEGSQKTSISITGFQRVNGNSPQFGDFSWSSRILDFKYF